MSFAHVEDSGGMRRSWLKEPIDVTKRYLITVAAHNFSRFLRKLLRVGKPRMMNPTNVVVPAIIQIVDVPGAVGGGATTIAFRVP